MPDKNRLQKLETAAARSEHETPQIEYISVIKDLGNGLIEVEQCKLGMGGYGYKVVYKGPREGYKNAK